MRNFTEQEFIDLVNYLNDRRYDYEEEEMAYDYGVYEDIDPVITIKKKSLIVQNNTWIDLTNANREKIRDSLFKFMGLKIGNYTIRIRNYNGKTCSEEDIALGMSITVYHDVFMTPLGCPCNMTLPLNVCKDKKFAELSWIGYFSDGGHGTEIPVETMVEIIRYFQVIDKLSSFI